MTHAEQRERKESRPRYGSERRRPIRFEQSCFGEHACSVLDIITLQPVTTTLRSVCDLDLMGRQAPLRIAFITSTPLNAREGSGTFVGIETLAGALARLDVQV